MCLTYERVDKIRDELVDVISWAGYIRLELEKDPDSLAFERILEIEELLEDLDLDLEEFQQKFL